MNLENWLENYFKQAVTFVKNSANLTACSQIIELENGECYILHQQSERATNLGINYGLEWQILNTITPLNIAPNVLYHNQHFTILSYIQGAEVTQFTLPLLSQLAQHLAKLHQFNDPQAVRFLQKFANFDIVERCHFLYKQLTLQQKQCIDISILKPIKPFAKSICHHDLHLGNFIENDGQLFLIDWEYAAVSDPALDIALFFNANELTIEQKNYFFDYYLVLTKFNQQAFKSKINEYQIVVNLLNQVWEEVAK
ncbi:phosphotransferase [Pasteurella atlantica]|uniref:phosphotransferase n=2 Tax=Pasteurellales TaxID=135625 RepID=UPI00275861D1|nr:phosphotransferase [Pasteurella atlantica]MDP8032740.1 phosphotransferase [Pasteurella atlantica]MDP8034754.1 phosphotransferase [Pasteurella atlantica]MDP8036704.1 phosphotransferase [Pasteurella atlantica]MDP8046974.1 phosphotransferase [Pasteurella atlantica]MDP8048927.1 phosphotransferase [Pasteurella atlantica]